MYVKMCINIHQLLRSVTRYLRPHLCPLQYFECKVEIRDGFEIP